MKVNNKMRKYNIGDLIEFKDKDNDGIYDYGIIINTQLKKETWLFQVYWAVDTEDNSWYELESKLFSHFFSQLL